MRLELVGRLFSNPPRFLIRFDGERVTGPAATDEFDALEVALDERYAPALVGDDYTIYERRPDASRGAQSGAPGRRARGQ